MYALPPEIFETREPRVSGVTCPDCAGTLEVQREGRGNLRFTCRIGHTMSVDALLSGKEDKIESDLWASVRTAPTTSGSGRRGTTRGLLGKLPSDLPAVVGVVLHRSPHHETQLPWVLGRHAVVKVIEPDDGTPLAAGVGYVAPRDQHLLFEDGQARLSRGPREHRTRPAVDPLFRSAAASFGPRVVGVLLTGYGGDGVPGLIAITAAGGLSVVQDPSEAAHPIMPRRAISEDNVQAVLPLDGIAAALVALAHGRALYRAPPAEVRG